VESKGGEQAKGHIGCQAPLVKANAVRSGSESDGHDGHTHNVSDALHGVRYLSGPYLPILTLWGFYDGQGQGLDLRGLHQLIEGLFFGLYGSGLASVPP